MAPTEDTAPTHTSDALAATTSESNGRAANIADDGATDDSATEMNTGEKTPPQHAPATHYSSGEKGDVVVTKDDTAAHITSAMTGVDENGVVFWDGDDDPQNPYNWKTWVKVFNCVLISALTFVTPLASCMSLSQPSTH